MNAFTNTPPAGPFWVVPTEVAIALAPLAVRAQVDMRRARGDDAAPHATVFRRAGKLVAVMDFKRGGALQFHLVVALIENAG